MSNCAASSSVKSSDNNSAISIVFLVDILVDILAESRVDSFLISPMIVHSWRSNSVSIDGNFPRNKVYSSVSLKGVISKIANLSNNALSITLVEVYSTPTFAVAINETPFATLIVG